MRSRVTRPLRTRSATCVAAALVATSVVLVGASSAYAAPVSDSFDRADSTDLGSGWTETGTELSISGNKLTNPIVSNPFAQAVGGTGSSVEADVAAGSGAGSYAKLSLRVVSAADNYSVILMDEIPNDGHVAFTTLKLLVGETVVRQQLVGLVPDAHLRLLNTVGDTVRATVDTGGEPGPEFTETWTMPSSASGTGVGLAASGGATIDNFASSTPSPTTTTLTYEPATPYEGDDVTLTAVVTASGTPVGGVEFIVGGIPSTVAVSGGQAQLLVSDLPLGSTPVSARFVPTDDAAVAESIDADEIEVLERSEPSIIAELSSAAPPTASGWYRGDVHVDYSCTADGSPLVGACPADEDITGQGANLTRTRTVTAGDGGTGSVTVSVDIDRTAPGVSITGLGAGPLFEPPASVARCVGTDALSGVSSCTLSVVARPKGRTEVVAVATDRAGHTARTSRMVRTPDHGVLGVPYVKKRYEVRRGKTVTLVVLGAKKAYLLAVGGVAMRAKPFKKKNSRWELRVQIPADLPLGKTVLTLRRGAHATFTLPVTVRR